MLTQPANNEDSRPDADPARWLEDHGDYLFGYALARVRERDVAEDLVQESLLAAMQAKAGFAGRSTERTWLCGILRHKILDHFRRPAREVELTEEEADLSSYDYLFRAEGIWKGHYTPDARPRRWNDDPERVLEHAEFRATLTHCVGELPERIAQAFTLREMEELASDEICRALGVSPNNFWVMMHRARMHLRRCLDFNWFKKQD